MSHANKNQKGAVPEVEHLYLTQAYEAQACALYALEYIIDKSSTVYFFYNNY